MGLVSLLSPLTPRGVKRESFLLVFCGMATEQPLLAWPSGQPPESYGEPMANTVALCRVSAANTICVCLSGASPPPDVVPPLAGGGSDITPCPPEPSAPPITSMDQILGYTNIGFESMGSGPNVPPPLGTLPPAPPVPNEAPPPELVELLVSSI